jgi:hypothetical protein
MRDYWESDPLSLCPVVLNLLKTSERKRRLCACFSVRQIIWDILPNTLKRVVECSEEFADENVARKEYFAITRAARAPYRDLLKLPYTREAGGFDLNSQWLFHAVSSVDFVTTPKFALVMLSNATSQAWEAVRWWMEAQGKTEQEKLELTTSVKEKFAALALEFFEYLSSPIPMPASWPRAVTILAKALYHGEDCAYALHDALEENGQIRLADHFSAGAHPKGCWALDVILAKS